MLKLQPTVALVVAEANSAWPEWVERWQRRKRDVVLIVRAPGENVADLGARVRDRVKEILDRGARLDAATLLGDAKFQSMGALALTLSEQVDAGAVRLVHADGFSALFQFLG